MFNEKDILTRLQKGENIEDIAKELTATLNKANKTYKDQESQKAKEKALAEKRETQKIADMAAVIEAGARVFAEYWPEFADEVKDVDCKDIAKELIKEIESTVKLAHSMTGILNDLEDMMPKAKKKSDVDTTIKEFLKSQGW